MIIKKGRYSMKNKHQLFLALLTIFVVTTNSLRLTPAQAKTTQQGKAPAGLSADDWAQIRPMLSAALPTQQAYLKASNTGIGDNFGRSVAVSGNTVVVGAWEEDSNASGVNGDQANNSISDAGAVYVFTRMGTVWSQQAYLKASNPDVQDYFGQSVAIAGDTIVVGAPWEDSNATGVDGNQADNSVPNSGAAYVFTRTGTTWSQQAYLKASNTDTFDHFGHSVAIAGETIVVGAYQEDSNATGVNGNQADNSAGVAGAAYVFTRTGTTWSQQAYLKASNTDVSQYFGEAVAISDNTVVVGAWAESSNATGVNGDQTNNLATQSGAAYIFTRTGTTWSQQAYLKASNPDAYDQFGKSVAISGNTVVVGAYRESSNTTGVNGNQTNNLAHDAGAAYVFTRTGTTWSQQAYLKASNPDADDFFGESVAIAGNAIVVGAKLEDSNATGVNGNQADNSASISGAAYVFTRTGTTWSQQAYLKASNTDTTDIFGEHLAIADNTVVVGAYFEESGATGVNGNQADNSANDAGAAYVFVLPSSTTPTPTPPPTTKVILNQSYLIQYDTWIGVTNASAFAGGYRHATSGTLTFHPDGPFTQFTWISQRGPDQGKAQIIVDGSVKATVDLFRATTQWQAPVQIKGLANTRHTVVIKALNSKNAASSGKWVAVDGFNTVTSLKTTPTSYDDRLIYISGTFRYGSWAGIMQSGSQSGAYRISNSAKASMTFAFNGSQVTWITALGPSYGKAAIYVDGVLKQTVDLYKATQQWQYRVKISGLVKGNHTVFIKVLGSKNSNSSGIDVIADGFEIQ
jgi:drug/metabolite transporter superfamily protein YnfA